MFLSINSKPNFLLAVNAEVNYILQHARTIAQGVLTWMKHVGNIIIAVRKRTHDRKVEGSG